MSNSSDSNSPPNLPEFSVSELSHALKRTVEDNFSYVRVRGELSGLARPRSGHVYFALKDDKSLIDGVCWKGVAAKFNFKPEDGLEVICTGRLSTYPARSKYQIIVERMEPAGVGALLAQLEERRKKLAGEGLFAPERKKAIPYLPRTIGVVTSPTGAVIRDILHRLRDRFPRHVLVWPVLVQGEGAAEQVAKAIRGFNAMPAEGAVPRPDLLIVARGGGSIEDLWSFNEEVVVRAAAESDIPLISAVGHETDTTLIDFASDRRAPTPTAAAEMAVPVRGELMAQNADLARRLDQGANRLIETRRRELAGLARGLRGPRDSLAMAEQRLDDISGRLLRSLITLKQDRQSRLDRIASGLRPTLLRQDIGRRKDLLDRLGAQQNRNMQQHIERARQRLAGEVKLLSSLSYQNVLARGFALIRDEAGRPLMRATDAKAGMQVEIQFADAARQAVIAGDDGPARPPAPSRPKKPKSSKVDHDQGDLF